MIHNNTIFKRRKVTLENSKITYIQNINSVIKQSNQQFFIISYFLYLGNSDLKN